MLSLVLHRLCETRISVADEQMYKMSFDTLVLVFKLANSGWIKAGGLRQRGAHQPNVSLVPRSL